MLNRYSKKEYDMNDIVKVLHTAKTETTGDRDSGSSRSSDGLLDIRLSTPGSARIGTNPEQLFAAGWSASFANAITLVARKRKIALPAKVSIEAEVDLNLGDRGYFSVLGSMSGCRVWSTMLQKNWWMKQRRSVRTPKRHAATLE